MVLSLYYNRKRSPIIYNKSKIGWTGIKLEIKSIKDK